MVKGYDEGENTSFTLITLSEYDQFPLLLLLKQEEAMQLGPLGAESLLSMTIIATGG